MIKIILITAIILIAFMILGFMFTIILMGADKNMTSEEKFLEDEIQLACIRSIRKNTRRKAAKMK